MDSTKDTQIVGQYMHPVIDQTTKNEDPWRRNYFQPPPFKNLVPRKFPLIDVRPLLSDPEYTPANLLKSHGFGVVTHRSALFEQPLVDGELDQQAVTDVYHPEIRELVKKTTGAKHVFITAGAFRRGKSAPEAYKLPVKLQAMKPADADDSKQSKDETKPTEKAQEDKSVGRSRLALAAPVRIPHLDYTPLGARQTIRFQSQEIYNTALEGGVIAAEDKICESHPFQAPTKEADAVIAEHYNQNDTLGPRYAAYSIWRPLKKVERDPLTLAPRREHSAATDGEMVYWRYENKVPGPEELSGDFLKEYAMLGVQGEDAATQEGNNSLKWYYVSGQERDEVLFIKLFDSASLGADAQHAGAPWHASPEIGNAQGDETRESLDIRVLVFW
ncbi:Gibberellin cluster GA4 desaturase [Cladobotryum mycophilum]|uniref:Gibberellin cluster GA4 desaturase n=1 Tax=Cladobotryum mycophilum TaxID=491253 RepID=A0ABR0SZT9_9HYPO